MEVRRFINHSKKAIEIAIKAGWSPGARYTNLRDVKSFDLRSNGFIDIDWKNYDFGKHLDVVATHQPLLTIARDIESIFDLDEIIKEAEKLLQYCTNVALVPKDPKLEGRLDELLPKDYMLAYSVTTKYGGTKISCKSFDRPVHLLGGRPDIQRVLANLMNVVSVDCNRFTYDARFGDYFDGEIFRPHPLGGYETCLQDSVLNINKLWEDYSCDSSFMNTKIK